MLQVSSKWQLDVSSGQTCCQEWHCLCCCSFSSCVSRLQQQLDKSRPLCTKSRRKQLAAAAKEVEGGRALVAHSNSKAGNLSRGATQSGTRSARLASSTPSTVAYKQICPKCLEHPRRSADAADQTGNRAVNTTRCSSLAVVLSSATQTSPPRIHPAGRFATSSSGGCSHCRGGGAAPLSATTAAGTTLGGARSNSSVAAVTANEISIAAPISATGSERWTG
jgi:hypothetical protein